MTTTEISEDQLRALALEMTWSAWVAWSIVEPERRLDEVEVAIDGDGFAECMSRDLLWLITQEEHAKVYARTPLGTRLRAYVDELAHENRRALPLLSELENGERGVVAQIDALTHDQVLVLHNMCDVLVQFGYLILVENPTLPRYPYRLSSFGKAVARSINRTDGILANLCDVFSKSALHILQVGADLRTLGVLADHKCFPLDMFLRVQEEVDAAVDVLTEASGRIETIINALEHSEKRDSMLDLLTKTDNEEN